MAVVGKQRSRIDAPDSQTVSPSRLVAGNVRQQTDGDQGSP